MLFTRNILRNARYRAWPLPVATKEKKLLLKTYEAVKQTRLVNECAKEYCANILDVRCSTKQRLFQKPNKFSVQRNTRLEVRREQTTKDRWIYSHPPHEPLYQPVQMRVQGNTEGTKLKEVLCPFTYLYNLQQPHIYASTKTTLPMILSWIIPEVKDKN